MWRKLRTTEPYRPDAEVESLPPGGSSMNGMNLSGKPGIAQPMQMPPTLGQITTRTLDKEPKWRRRGKELTTGATRTW